jgi:hypothetical protein
MKELNEAEETHPAQPRRSYESAINLCCLCEGYSMDNDKVTSGTGYPYDSGSPNRL